MKVLLFTDIHSNRKIIRNLIKKSKDVDLVVTAGDLSFFSMELKETIDLLGKIKKPMLLIHGNHETHKVVVEYCKPYKNFNVIHKKVVRVGEYVFVGYGGGGFDYHYPDLQKLIPKVQKKLKKDDQVVFVTHAPPYKTKLDYLPWVGNVGSKTAIEFIKKIKPILLVCGHLHEFFGKRDKLGKTVLINPGPEGIILNLKQIKKKRDKVKA